MIYSGNDQDGSQDGHQTGRQESADSDRLERYGKTTCKESEINPARHLKKNVSISNMTEEYGFGKSFDSMDFDELFANSGRFKPRLGQMARYVGM